MLCLYLQLTASAVDGQDPLHSPGICPNLSPPVSGSFLQSRLLLLSSTISSRNPSFRPQTFSFHNLNILYRKWNIEYRSTICHYPPNSWFCLILLLIGGFRMCHFCLFQTLSKFATDVLWLQIANSGLLEVPPVHFQSFIRTHTRHFLYPVSVHNLSFNYFFFNYNIHPVRFKLIKISNKLMSCRRKSKF